MVGADNDAVIIREALPQLLNAMYFPANDPVTTSQQVWQEPTDQP